MSKGIKKDCCFQNTIGDLVRMNLAFHNLNKGAEDTLGLSLVQYHFLHTLRDLPGSYPQRISQVVGMHPSTLTQSVKRLQKRKLIFVEEDPRDSRKKILGLTIEGGAAIKMFEQGMSNFLELESVKTLTLNLGLIYRLDSGGIRSPGHTGKCFE